jgi:hypothetical protein
LIEAAELSLPQNSLTTCIDASGVYYRIPIACINDPLKYEQDHAMKALEAKDKPEEATIHVSRTDQISFIISVI